MLIFLRLFFTGQLLGAAGFVYLTTDPAAGPIASHFDGTGHADAYMASGYYRMFMIFFAAIFPLIMVVMIAGMPRLFPGITNIPNRDYWFAPQQRAETLLFLEKHALVFGCMLVLFICGVHWLVLLANHRTPPQLANGPFLILLVVFMAAVFIWLARLMRRFRKPL